jgi:hypothetical protein
MSAPPQSTAGPTSESESPIIEEITGSLSHLYYDGATSRFIERNPHQTSTYIRPSYDGTAFKRNSSACIVDRDPGHQRVHYHVIDAFRDSLAWYATENGPCETQKQLDEACRAMAGLHNNGHNNTKIYVWPEASYTGDDVFTKITVADSLKDWVTRSPFYRVKIYKGESKAKSGVSQT